MTRRIASYSVLLAFLLGSGATYPAPIDDFYSDAFVGKAATHIGTMAKVELEYFIEYIASCTADTKSEVQTFFCERDRAIFEIKYLEQNELRRLIGTMAIVERRIGQLSDSSPGSNDRNELTKLLFRSSDIIRKLKEAATIYYAVASKKQP